MCPNPLQIWTHLLKEYLVENVILCEMLKKFWQIVHKAPYIICLQLILIKIAFVFIRPAELIATQR